MTEQLRRTHIKASKACTDVSQVFQSTFEDRSGEKEHTVHQNDRDVGAHQLVTLPNTTDTNKTDSRIHLEDQDIYQHRDTMTHAPSQGHSDNLLTPSLHTRHRRRREEMDSLSTVECTLGDLAFSACDVPQVEFQLKVTFPPEQLLPPACTNENIQFCRNGEFCERIRNYAVHVLIREGVDMSQFQCLLDQPIWDRVHSMEVIGLPQEEVPLDLIFTTMTSLAELTLYRGALTSFTAPEEDSTYAQLHTLNVSDNALTDLSNVVKRLPNLEMLVAEDNPLSSLPAGSFGATPNMKTLDLTNCGLTSIEAAAFRPLGQLLVLELDQNQLTSIQSTLLTPLTNLNTLLLDGNPLVTLPDDTLSKQTQLQVLSLQRTPLASFPENLFAATSVLERLQLDHCRLTTLPPKIFSNLSALKALHLAYNLLEQLHRNTFQGLTQLELVFLQGNALTAVVSGTFDGLIALQVLNLDQNQISQLPQTLLADSPQLQHFSLANNNVPMLPLTVLHSAAELKRLHAPNNRITQLDLSRLSKLTFVYMNGNPIRNLSGVHHLIEVETFSINGHELHEVRLEHFVNKPKLVTLQIAAGSVQSQARLVSPVINSEEEKVAIQENFQHLTTLDLRNLEVDDLSPFLLATLQSFGMGWPRMEDGDLLHSIVESLASNVQEFFLTRTLLTNVTLPAGRTFEAVHLELNEQMLSVDIDSNVEYLNVSYCPRLTRLVAQKVDTLDISGTRIPLSDKMCATQGRSRLFARGLLSGTIARDDLVIRDMLRRCMEQASVIDLSGNRQLRSLMAVRVGTQETLGVSSTALTTIGGDEIPVRDTIPILAMQNAPIACNLQLQSLRALRSQAELPTTEVIFSHICACASGFHHSKGECHRTKSPVLGIALGSVFAVLPVCIFYLTRLCYRRRVRHLRSQRDLGQALLDEREAEVIALRSVWQIKFDQVRLIRRLASGAYGVVFKAEWDSIIVAVKVLKQPSVDFFDDGMEAEFEKEVEFLQRTRHQHVVRFFGAGQTPENTPFMVLEFVPLGSLKDLLKRDFEELLADYANQMTQSEEGGDDNFAEAAPLVNEEEEHELVVVTTSSASAEDVDVASVWELKRRLAHDIASGMAFIHSLDQMHRDLKSGNVLVSSKLRAKISDFGTIRQRLSAETTRTEAPADMAYSQHVGAQTLGLTLTAGVGTPLYMAPEVLVGSVYGRKADVFSFGVLMWEIANQKVPDLIAQEVPGFRGPMFTKLLDLLNDGKRLVYPAPSETTSALAAPEWYRALSLECMSQVPSHRPTFQELRTALL
ncbi:TKL protein kinase [Salpingoeca rosetta]|uniref:TKL protein kinase n=1 Tax=Salpingoeca rosetta (strain ATCC 50818 / BSB-021) TaxID=946362 RepID=F2UIL2_SALR5|nr:TKL protein kinase [Salpingoeca rosetta]EGD77061.1 TKL protein kinase [Salpingoeca rosetta]|eukprot:XP_004990901.1 TKL protein kinase [Salpingoeca rosetta]